MSETTRLVLYALGIVAGVLAITIPTIIVVFKGLVGRTVGQMDRTFEEMRQGYASLGAKMEAHHLDLSNKIDGIEKDGMLAQQKWAEDMRLLERSLPDRYVRREEYAAATATIAAQLERIQAGQDRTLDRLDRIHDAMPAAKHA